MLYGWLPWVLIALAVPAAGSLLYRRERWWRWRLVPAALVLAGVSAWLIGQIGGEKLFAKPVTTSDTVWIAVGLAAVLLALGFAVRTTWWRKVVAVVAAVVVLAAAGNQINSSYAQFPTVGDLFGPPTKDRISALPPLTAAPAPGTSVMTSSAAPVAGPLTTVWKPAGPDIPRDGRGKLSPITIPGTVSGFTARPGWVYLPPAYFAQNPEPLPVLVLIAGQPGSPEDWLAGDRVQNLMNDFAGSHAGIAPVVVMPDALGSVLANPLCTDSSLGNADTYLSRDVPAAIRAQLRVDPDPRRWVVAGFSYGGTCALQLATQHPDVYPNFVDIAGQAEPTLGSGSAGRQTTVDTAFGGDTARFRAINPADQLGTRKYPNSAGWFIWGERDPDTGAALAGLSAAAGAAGMSVTTWTAPGSGHDWNTVTTGLAHAMPWLATRMNLTA